MLRLSAAFLIVWLIGAPTLNAADAITESRALAATGDEAKAIELLRAEIKKQPDSAALHAELAQRFFQSGDRSAAEKSIGQALKLSPIEPQARWLQAELWRDEGKLKEAEAGYKWHFNVYNRREIDNAEELFWVAKGVGEYVRWRRLHDAYSTLVNEVYPRVLELDPRDWRARLEMGRLFLEKYNFAEADRQFVAGLKIDPNAAELHAARAELFLSNYDLDNAQASLRAARDINPRLLAVHQLAADLDFANFRPTLAVDDLEQALALRPHDEATLGRLAAAYLAIDGFELPRPITRFEKLEMEVCARNPHAGRFYAELAAALDLLRRYPAAARYWQQTIEVMPQHPQARGQLGMIQMRLGDEAGAKKTLARAFDDDPFNVRVKNSLAVLEVLETYETIETPHFLIRFDPKHDRVLARSAAEYLEGEVFGAVTKQLGYAPPDKTLIEIFSKAKNTSGHGWFSARMVGLPSVGTVGACAGKIVAMASPNEMERKFNWAQVLKHEFIHVVNLQQTEFGIPHWYTEALAVHNEGYPRPSEWDRLLAARLAEKKLFNLDTINYGFVRPESDEAWSLAYCQAELYAQFMLAEFGDDALAKLLAAYADRLETVEAIGRAFAIPQAEFERRYLAYVGKIVAALPKSAESTQRTFAELQEVVAREPDNADAAAELALALVKRKSYAESRRCVDKALKAQPKHSLAAYVRARLHLVVGEDRAAQDVLEQCLDRDKPQPNALALLAGLKLRNRKYTDAAALYELGAKQWPQEIKWPKALAVVYLQSRETEKFAAVLEQIALVEPDNFSVRKKLAEFYHNEKNHAATLHWATEAIHANCGDAAAHRMRGQAYAELGEKQRAVASLENALLLEPRDNEAKQLLSRLRER